MPSEDATLAEYKARLAKNKALVLEQVEHVVNRATSTTSTSANTRASSPTASARVTPAATP